MGNGYGIHNRLHAVGAFLPWKPPKLPDINVPDFNVPAINVPDFNVPAINVPDFNVPTVPSLSSLPEVQWPKGKSPRGLVATVRGLLNTHADQEEFEAWLQDERVRNFGGFKVQRSNISTDFGGALRDDADFLKNVPWERYAGISLASAAETTYAATLEWSKYQAADINQFPEEDPSLPESIPAMARPPLSSFPSGPGHSIAQPCSSLSCLYYELLEQYEPEWRYSDTYAKSIHIMSYGCFVFHANNTELGDRLDYLGLELTFGLLLDDLLDKVVLQEHRSMFEVKTSTSTCADLPPEQRTVKQVVDVVYDWMSDTDTMQQKLSAEDYSCLGMPDFYLTVVKLVAVLLRATFHKGVDDIFPGVKVGDEVFRLVATELMNAAVPSNQADILADANDYVDLLSEHSHRIRGFKDVGRGVEVLSALLPIFAQGLFFQSVAEGSVFHTFPSFRMPLYDGNSVCSVESHAIWHRTAMRLIRSLSSLLFTPNLLDGMLKPADTDLFFGGLGAPKLLVHLYRTLDDVAVLLRSLQLLDHLDSCGEGIPCDPRPVLYKMQCTFEGICGGMPELRNILISTMERSHCVQADPDSSKQHGGSVGLWPCTKTAAHQRWIYSPESGQFRSLGNAKLCLTRERKKNVVKVRKCKAGRVEQAWTIRGDEIVARNSELCLDAKDGGNADGKAIRLKKCAQSHPDDATLQASHQMFYFRRG